MKQERTCNSVIEATVQHRWCVITNCRNSIFIYFSGSNVKVTVPCLGIQASNSSNVNSNQYTETK